MVIFVSLLTAAFFGAGDFAGALATKRASVIEVVAGSHIVGLGGVFVASILIADAFTWVDIFIGTAAGALGGLGVALLYRRLAEGPMAVVAPLTALASAAIPVMVDWISGGVLSVLAWSGIAVGLLAIVLVSMKDESAPAPTTIRVVAESLVAGVGFGGFLVLIDLTDAATFPWPIVGARAVTAVVLVGWLAGRRRPLTVSGGVTIGLILAVGTLDTLSNVLFLYATSIGELAIVAVLSALYPVVTVLLARVLLDERIATRQLAGFALALTATIIIGLG